MLPSWGRLATLWWEAVEILTDPVLWEFVTDPTHDPGRHPTIAPLSQTKPMEHINSQHQGNLLAICSNIGNGSEVGSTRAMAHPPTSLGIFSHRNPIYEE